MQDPDLFRRLTEEGAQALFFDRVALSEFGGREISRSTCCSACCATSCLSEAALSESVQRRRSGPVA